MIYLDSAATTLIKPASVERAVIHAMRSMASPGRGAHTPAMRAAEEVYNCRLAAAGLFNVPEAENIVFTFNATHALNLAINSMLRKVGKKAVISGFEHNSVTRPLHAGGAEIRVAGTGLFEKEQVINDFAALLPWADFAVCTYVSNVFGYILPVYDIAALCRKHHVPLIVDASQAAGILPVDSVRLGADYIAMPGHKGLFGPQGTGILICAGECEPLLHGGSGSDSIPQHMPEYYPDRLEAGTHNVCGIAGLHAGIEYVLAVGTAGIQAHEQKLLSHAIERLKAFEGIEFFAGEQGEQSGVISFRSAAKDCESIASELGERGICVRSGLHCAPYAHRSAGTIKTGTVRLSFSPFINISQLDTALDALEESLH